MSELARRVAVAAIGIPIVLGLVYLGGWFMAVPLAGFAGWAAHEVYRFAAKKDVRAIEWAGVSASAAFVLLAAWRPSFVDFAPPALALIAALTVVVVLESMRTRGPQGHPLAVAAVTLFGAVYTGFALAFALLLHALPAEGGWAAAGTSPALAGLLAVVLPLAATWIGDASAYFAGTAWGKSKLAPTISPNKSWVGFWAALIGAGVAATLWMFVAGSYLPQVRSAGPVLLALSGALLGAMAVVGDLAESLLKREAGVKDSGTFFPGHGGVLDRVDSLLFTVPGAYVLLQLLVAFS